MGTSQYTTDSAQATPLLWVASEVSATPLNSNLSAKQPLPKLKFAPLAPLRRWLDGLEISDRKMAQTLAAVIPAQCPFERTVTVFGRPVLHIPPLCKLNPFYEEVVGLRFRALCYLADVCGDDISSYC